MIHHVIINIEVKARQQQPNLLTHTKDDRKWQRQQNTVK